jgi:tetratricopeptide (TPR) repeat protein
LKAKKPKASRPDNGVSTSGVNSKPGGLTPRRKFWFRVVAVSALLLNFLLLELILRVFGYGYSSSFFLKAKADGREVFIENAEFSRRYFPPGLQRTPQPVSFAAQKPADTIRIFVFGESAAMGDPEPAFGFPRVLDVLLSGAMTGKKIEVINVAVTAINSHVLREIAKDCAGRQGDYWLVYMGNNEVVGPFGAGTVFGEQTLPLSVIRAGIWLKSTRLGQLLDALKWKLARQSSVPKQWDGMEMFLQQQVRQDDARMKRVYEHFAANLRDIIRIGEDSGAKVLVSTVGGNVKDCAPFASLHRADFTAAQRAEFDGFIALTNHQEALKLDDTYAETWFRVGRAQMAAGDLTNARVSLQKARDLDTLRFRADTRINQIIRENVPVAALLDMEARLAGQSPGAMPGEEFFYEHVHFNFAGNFLVARAFAEAIAGGTNRLGADECAARLAFTDFNRHRLLDEVLQRLRQPPFTQQLDHEAREQRIQAQLKFLKSASFTNALQQYEQAIAGRPADWVLRENFAELLGDFGESERAEAQWRKMLELMPHSDQACYGLANALDMQGKSAEAIRWFSEALRRRPGSVEARNGLALALGNQGATDAAIAEFNRLLKTRPDFVEARVNLGRLLAEQGKFPEAQAHYTEALRLQSNSVAANINLGKLFSRQGRYEDAARHYREAVRLKPENAVAHFNLGNALRSLNAPGAEAEFAEAVRLKPDFAEARGNYGLALSQRGDDTGAMEQFREAARLRPKSAEARLNLGVALARAKRYAEAAEEFREALKLEPGNAQARRFLEQAESRR